MSDITPCAEYLLKNFLLDFLTEGKSPRLPPPAKGSKIDQCAVAEIAATLITKLDADRRPLAGVSLTKKEVHFSHGWLCDRWCSTYLVLKSLLQTPVPETPLVPVLEPLSEFRWPDSVPMPWTTADPFVVHSNRVLPWAVLPTVLHEVAHAFIDTTGRTVHEIEFACDEFAARYFLGQRNDPYTDIVILGVTVWQCCICSYSLSGSRWQSAKHPNPVARLQRVLRGFVPPATEIGERAWLLATAHVIMLARFYDMPDLDGRVLLAEHADVDALLDDLRRCWEPEI